MAKRLNGSIDQLPLCSSSSSPLGPSHRYWINVKSHSKPSRTVYSISDGSGAKQKHKTEKSLLGNAYAFLNRFLPNLISIISKSLTSDLTEPGQCGFLASQERKHAEVESFAAYDPVTAKAIIATIMD